MAWETRRRPPPYDPTQLPVVIKTIEVPMWRDWQRCGNCNRRISAHEDGKCLFGPGTWKPLTTPTPSPGPGARVLR